MHLRYWTWHSGLADLLPLLRRTAVYVRVSGGSMVVTPNFGETYDGRNLPTGSDRALGLVDFTEPRPESPWREPGEEWPIPLAGIERLC